MKCIFTSIRQKILLVVFFFAISAVQCSVFAQNYLYPGITHNYPGGVFSNSVTGNGTWSNATVLPSFSFATTTTNLRIYDFANTLQGATDEVDATNPWETKYGQINASTTNTIKVRSDWNQSSNGQPLKAAITTVVTFNSTAQPGNWGFLVLDIDVDQVRIRAKDASGNYYSNAVINSWFKGAFDMSANSGNSTPCWDATNATVIGREYTCVRQTVLNEATETEGAAAYFEPNLPVSTIEFIFDNLQPTTGSPSQRYFFAAARTYSVSGNVFNDPNAGNVNNSSGTTNLVPSGMYANLVGSDGNVAAVTPVATNGTYSFANVGPDTYTVVLSTIQGTVGSDPPNAFLPSGWINTGEFNGTPNTGNTAPVDGKSASFVLSTADVTNINFGIRTNPVCQFVSNGTFTTNLSGWTAGTGWAQNGGRARNQTDNISNSTLTQTLYGLSTGNLVLTFELSALNTGGTGASLAVRLNGTTYATFTNPNTTAVLTAVTQNGAGVSWSGLTAGNSTYTRTTVTVYIPYSGTQVADLDFVFTAAGANADDFEIDNVELSGICPVTISGTVFNDNNMNTRIDGAEAGTSAGTDLFVYLVNSSGVIVDSAKVNSNGTYTLDAAVNQNYQILLSKAQYTIGTTPVISTTPPAGWFTTGENGSGNNTGSGDGTPNGILAVTVAAANIVQQNFGIYNPGYIYVHKKASDENSAGSFQFSVSGGPTSVGNFTLTDEPAQIPVNDIGASSNGTLWAVGTNNILYYRLAGSSVWVVTSVTNAARVDGGAGNTAYVVTTSGELIYFNGATSSTLATSGVSDVGSAWDNRPYVVGTNGWLYRYTGTGSSALAGTSWPRYNTSATGILKVDGNPAQPDVPVFVSNNGNIYRAESGTNTINLGRPANTTGASYDVAVDHAGNIYSIYMNPGGGGTFPYKWVSGTSWTSEENVRSVANITGGPGNQIWAGSINNTGAGYATNIFTRSYNGSAIVWIDDERVNTTSAGTNSILIPVIAGTYTLTELAAAGWDLYGLVVSDPTANSTVDLLNRNATITVGQGEVVNVIFKNGFIYPFAMTNDCSAEYKEDFGTGSVNTFGNALTGQTSYHYHNTSVNGADGYYKVIGNTSQFASWAVSFNDHTSNNGQGRMMAVNASFDFEDFFRRRFTGLVPGATYDFSAWLASFSNDAVKPNATFLVVDSNKNVLTSYSSGNITTAGVWNKYGFTFTATTTSVDLIIRNNATGGGGNDIAIDDITFKLIPPTVPVTTVVNSTCSSAGSITITSPLGASYEYSTNGSNWQTSPVFSNLIGGIYTVSARFAGTVNCVASQQDTISSFICGTVFNDVNSNTVIDGGEVGTTAGTSLYVYLVNPSGLIIDSVRVKNDGTYQLDVAQHQNYNLFLSRIQYTKGTTPAAISTIPPSGWMTTGENGSGNNAGSGDGTPNGILAVTVGAANVVQQNFGLLQQFTPCEFVSNGTFSTNLSGWVAGTGWAQNGGRARNQTDNISNSALTQTVSGLSHGNIDLTFELSALNTGSTGASLAVQLNGTTYVTFNNPNTTAVVTAAAQNGASIGWAGLTAGNSTYTRTNVTITIPYSGSQNANLSFVFTAAGANADDYEIDNVSLKGICPVTISGTVFNDNNVNTLIDAGETGTSLGGNLHVYLVDSLGVIVDSAKVNNDGTYSLSAARDRNYLIKISATQYTIGTSPIISTQISSNVILTGENGAGNIGTGDANPDGILAVAVGTSNVTQQNFGLTDICNPLAPGNIDTDGDGIADNCDEDDDNDGIPDWVECAPAFAGYSSATLTGANTPANTTISGIEFGSTAYGTLNMVSSGVTYVYPVGINSSMNISNSTIYNPSGSVSQPAIINTLNHYLNGNFYTDYTLTLSSPVTKVLLYTNDWDYMRTRFTGNHRERLLSGGTEFTYNPLTRELYDMNPNTASNITRDGFGVVEITSTNGLPFTTVTFRKFTDPNTGANPQGNNHDGNYFTFAVDAACDTDGDGIPDTKDTDSDNDGCPDAIEGSGDFGFGNLNMNQALSGAVGATGIPTQSGAGQGVGVSKDAAINACTDCEFVHTNGTFTTNLNGWTAGTGWGFNNGRARNGNDNITNSALSQSLYGLENGKTYELSFELGALHLSSPSGNSIIEVKLGGVTYATFTNPVSGSNIVATMSNGASISWSGLNPTENAAYNHSNVRLSIPYSGADVADISFVMTANGSNREDFEIDNVNLFGDCNSTACDAFTNGAFSDGTTGWNVGSGWNLINGYMYNIQDGVSSPGSLFSQTLNNVPQGSVDITMSIVAKNCQEGSANNAQMAIRLNGVTYVTFTNPSLSSNPTNIIATTANGATLSNFGITLNHNGFPDVWSHGVVLNIPNYTGPSNPLFEVVFTSSANGSTSCGDDFGIDNLGLSTGSCITIEGSVFNDADGNTRINGNDSVTTADTNLYVYLVNASGTIVDSAKVASDGTYMLDATANTNYTVHLSTVQYAIGTSPVINTIPPTGWVNTGENGSGNNTGNGDGNPDGVLIVNTGNSNVVQQNFGIQRPPVADVKSYYVPNTAFSEIPPAGFPANPDPTNPTARYFNIATDNSMLTGYTHNGSLTGKDAEDCRDDESCNTGSKFVLDSLYTGTILYYNFGGETGVRKLEAGDTIPGYDPSRLVIYALEGSGMAVPVGFTYSIVDAAGFSSSSAGYTILTESALPVELLYFEAENKQCDVHLIWSTASEQNNDYFTIFRSLDAVTWTEIARIEGAGNSNIPIIYNYADAANLNGTVYYKLVQTDFDGTSEHLPVRSVSLSSCQQFHVQVYPNPASSHVIIEIGALPTSGIELVQIYDMYGKVVVSEYVNDTHSKIDVSRLPSGNYIVAVGNDRQREIVKIIIAR